MHEERTQDRRGPGLWGIGFMLLVVLQGVRLDLPRVAVSPAPPAVNAGAMASGFAIRLGSAAVSVAWN